mgnify:CR=1 FL=1
MIVEEIEGGACHNLKKNKQIANKWINYKQQLRTNSK